MEEHVYGAWDQRIPSRKQTQAEGWDTTSLHVASRTPSVAEEQPSKAVLFKPCHQAQRTKIGAGSDYLKDPEREEDRKGQIMGKDPMVKRYREIHREKRKSSSAGRLSPDAAA
ncbi:uncharacterized protein LOC144576887 [Callithrix jacchus]